MSCDRTTPMLNEDERKMRIRCLMCGGCFVVSVQAKKGTCPACGDTSKILFGEVLPPEDTRTIMETKKETALALVRFLICEPLVWVVTCISVLMTLTIIAGKGH